MKMKIKGHGNKIREAGIKEVSQVSSLGSWVNSGTIYKVGDAGGEPGSACMRVVKMNCVGQPEF